MVAVGMPRCRVGLSPGPRCHPASSASGAAERRIQRVTRVATCRRDLSRVRCQLFRRHASAAHPPGVCRRSSPRDGTPSTRGCSPVGLRASAGESTGEGTSDAEDPDGPRPNGARWDAESSVTGLSAQLRTTNTLRQKLSNELFLADPSIVDPSVVYKSQVHEARGAEAYNELMKTWNPMVKRALCDFTYACDRAFSPEPGVVLIRWKAEWDGAFNADAAMLQFVEENFPEYEGEELETLRRDVEGVDRVWTGAREYSVKGITTVRVNALGKIVMHEDKIVEKDERLPSELTSGGGAGGWGLPGSVDGSFNEGADGNGTSAVSGSNPVGGSKVAAAAAGGLSKNASGDSEGDGFSGGKNQAGEFEGKVVSLDPDERAARDEFAVTVFYNALRPPGAKAVPWFFDVLLELEWQNFRRQVGDDTTMIQTKEEFVNTITVLLVVAVIIPLGLLSYAVLLGIQGAMGGGFSGDEYDQMIQQADAADRLAQQRSSTVLDVDLLKQIYGAKIGA